MDILKFYGLIEDTAPEEEAVLNLAWGRWEIIRYSFVLSLPKILKRSDDDDVGRNCKKWTKLIFCLSVWHKIISVNYTLFRKWHKKVPSATNERQMVGADNQK